jgi:hypothetical protein
MRDLWHDLLERLDHDRYSIVLPLATTAIILVFVFGCEPTAPSYAGDEQLTADQVAQTIRRREATFAERRAALEEAVAVFNADVDSFNDWADDAQTEIEREAAFRREVLQTGGVLVQESIETGFNPSALISWLLGLGATAWGVGTKIDNRRKDRRLKTLKLETGKQ